MSNASVTAAAGLGRGKSVGLTEPSVRYKELVSELEHMHQRALR